jgi:hypothetical protein
MGVQLETRRDLLDADDSPASGSFFSSDPTICTRRGAAASTSALTRRGVLEEVEDRRTQRGFFDLAIRASRDSEQCRALENETKEDLSTPNKAPKVKPPSVDPL